ncbi:MAG TPA: hypothetical protein PLS46_17530 [Microthrixaceae bacterium]|nr:hypothetical protein [Microthrixaceae bacterium]
MPMREECKFFESRTYATGESVRKCDLDLAPEAPWRCPENCAAFQPRLADVNWSHGTLITPPTPPEPASVGSDPSIAALLDEAENIVNAVVDSTRAEVDAERGRSPRSFGSSRGGGSSDRGWRRWFKRGG